jgi:hypothetical protein
MFLPWPITGNATQDRDLVARATHSWTAGEPGRARRRQ